MTGGERREQELAAAIARRGTLADRDPHTRERLPAQAQDLPADRGHAAGPVKRRLVAHGRIGAVGQPDARTCWIRLPLIVAVPCRTGQRWSVRTREPRRHGAAIRKGGRVRRPLGVNGGHLGPRNCAEALIHQREIAVTRVQAGRVDLDCVRAGLRQRHDTGRDVALIEEGRAVSVGDEIGVADAEGRAP